MKMLKKATAVFLSAALLLSAPAVDAIDIKSFAASNLTVSGGDSENHFSDKRENYVNEYFKYEENGKEIQTGTVINTVTFEFPSVSDLGLEIYTVTPYGDYLINAVDVSGTTSYALDFPLGGDFKARLVESGSEGSFTEFSVEIPDTDGDGIEEFGKNWGFIEHFSQELFSGVKTIDVSKFNIPNEDSNDWETWEAFNVIKDWNGIIGNALFNYDNVNGYITKINVEVYYVNSNISLDEEFKAYAHYVKSLVATLFPEGEYFTDLEKAVILNSYFCEFIGNIYGEGGNAYNALWYKDALCDGCARAFSLLCQLSGLNYIKGGSGVAAHAWNIIQVDGNWYQIDPLWGEDNPSEYFLRTDEEFIAHHNGNHNKYGESQIYWGRTLTESFPPCTDETFKSDEYIFRKASGHIFYKDGYFYYYILDGDSYSIYRSATLFHKDAELVSTGTELNDYFEYLNAPDLYCYVSDDTLGTGEKVYLSAGAPYYTNEGDPKDEKYKYVGVRPSLEALARGVVADYKLEVYDSSDTLLTTVQAAMYRLNVLSFNKPGTYKIKLAAEAENGLKAEKTVSITVTGEDVSTGDDDIVVNEIAMKEYVVWANGGKQKLEDGSSVNHKNAEIETTLEPTDWTDSKGKSKAGKIVWTASLVSQSPATDGDKHTVTTKSDKSVVTVSKGKLTAKSGGETGESIAYVYATDTGSLKSEGFIVTVKNAASAIYLFDSADKTEENKKEKLKSIAVVAGGSAEKVYILPTAKQGAVSSDCTYTISAKKNEDGIISFSDIKTDENGRMYFEVSGNKLAKAGKVSKISLTVTCDQSGKKGTLSVNVSAPVEKISLSGTGNVIKTGETVDFDVAYTIKGGSESYSDKIQVIVASTAPSVDETGKKVTSVKSKEVTAKLSKDGKTLTLKASKDITTAQAVYFIVTDQATKLKTVFKAADISTDGKITLVVDSEEEKPDSEAENGEETPAEN